jgi:hypothetical protein
MIRKMEGKYEELLYEYGKLVEEVREKDRVIE